MHTTSKKITCTKYIHNHFYHHHLFHKYITFTVNINPTHNTNTDTDDHNITAGVGSLHAAHNPTFIII